MTFLRKLEVISGMGTALLGLLVAWWLLRTDMQTFQNIDEEYPLPLALLAMALLFILPSLLIGAGSCLHGFRKRSQGRVMVIAGSLFLIIAFLGTFFTSGYQIISVIQARFVLTIAAITTLIISLIVSDRN
jgi:peptidoglycan/LPS O-acetylase OafA/YrhL